MVVPSSARAAPRAVIASPSDTTIVARSTRSRSSTRRQAIALGDAAAFDRCLARPAVIRSGPFALHLFWQSLLGTDAGHADAKADAGIVCAPAQPSWRLGLVIPKRFEASAVARNTIKRRWRDAFRRGRATWAEEFGSADVVVRMQAPLMKKSDAPLPAKVRARERFDPQDAFAVLAVRLRGRRPPSVAPAVLP